MRDAGATPNAVRTRELFALALSSESIERTSLLSELRKQAVAGRDRLLRVRELGVPAGRRGIGDRAAADGGGGRRHRIRYAAPVDRIRVSASGCVVTAATASASRRRGRLGLPVGPLRDIQVEGVSEERLGSLHRQRHALAAKAVFTYETSFWQEAGPERRGLRARPG